MSENIHSGRGSSCWQPSRHWLHRGLSFWHRPGGRGLSLWWPYGFRLPDLVYILSSLFIMNITEMIGISLRIVLRCFHDLMFWFFVVLRNKKFLIPEVRWVRDHPDYTPGIFTCISRYPLKWHNRLMFWCWSLFTDLMWLVNAVCARCRHLLAEMCWIYDMMFSANVLTNVQWFPHITVIIFRWYHGSL